MSDNYKSPAFVLSGVNTLWLAGLTAYGWRAAETFRAENVVLKKLIEEQAARITEIQAQLLQITEGLKRTHTLALTANTSVRNLTEQSANEVDELQEQLEAITQALESNGTTISIKQKPKGKTANKPTRHAKQPVSRSVHTEDEEDIDSIIDKVRSSKVKS